MSPLEGLSRVAAASGLPAPSSAAFAALRVSYAVPHRGGAPRRAALGSREPWIPWLRIWGVEVGGDR